MSATLSLKNIAKSYGKIQALKGVSFDVNPGTVFGILGPNGSGKTTLLAIVIDALKADSGNFHWFGQPGSADSRKKIGTLLETPNFYHYLSAVDNLKITQSISKRGDRDDIDTVLKKVNLYERRKDRFSKYSLGMKQRLAIAAALLGNPSVLVLDEPTNGLDPVGIAEIRTLIHELKEKGHTIIMASHLLDEVEKVCTHVAILKSGELIISGTVDDVLIDEDIVELSSSQWEPLMKLYSGAPHKIVELSGHQYLQLILPKFSADLQQINKHCFDNGITLNHLILKRKKLETRFFELTNN
jgi:ABC-2 type transport system ATP-binding protein